MATLKAFPLLAISAVLSIASSSPAMAGFSPRQRKAECEYVRRNINSRLPQAINLSQSEVKEVSINGHRSRECVVYGNATAIQSA